MLPTRMLHGECSVLADPTPIPRVSPILVIGTNVKYQNPEYSAQAQCQGLLSEGNISFRWGTYVVPSDAYGRLDRPTLSVRQRAKNRSQKETISGSI
jgi:hypothetical protein